MAMSPGVVIKEIDFSHLTESLDKEIFIHVDFPGPYVRVFFQKGMGGIWVLIRRFGSMKPNTNTEHVLIGNVEIKTEYYKIEKAREIWNGLVELGFTPNE